MSSDVADLDLDFSELESKYKTTLDESFDTYVVVDGAPVAPSSKVEALTKVMKKVLSPAGKIKEFYMPTDESGKTLGYVFIEAETEQDAKNLIKTFHNKKFDKNHTLHVDKLTNVGKYTSMDPEEYSEFKTPELPDFKPNPHFRSWLTDSQGRDQAAIHAGEKLSVSWFRKDGNPRPVIQRERMTESYARWSPKGTYLLTIHPQVVTLHAGPNFDQVAQFAHDNVDFVDFSPNERYLVTGSRAPLTAPNDDAQSWPFKESDEGNHIVIWDIATMAPLRTFPVSPLAIAATNPTPKSDPATAAAASTSSAIYKTLTEMERKRHIWPAFKWSHDSKYFGRISGPGVLSIYETPSMTLVGKKSQKINGIADFEFAPGLVNGKHVLAYWTPEMQNQTARVCLIDVATGIVVHNRSMFNVASCKIFWQNEAKYMCVKVDRFSKNKKTVLSSLDIWRLAEKSIGVDVIDLKEVVTNFAWEPNSSRFVCFSYLDQANVPVSPSKNVLSVYALESKKDKEGTWKEAYHFEGRSTSSIYWAPEGRFLVTASIKEGTKAVFEFWDADFEGHAIRNAGLPNAIGKDSNQDHSKNLPINLAFLKLEDSGNASDAAWDPSGRYFVAWSAMSRSGGTFGYRMWDVTGDLIRVENVDKLKAFLWRPRPESVLDEEVREDVRKNLKTYGEKYDTEDKLRASEESEELQRKRETALAQWAEFRARIVPKLLDLKVTPTNYFFKEVDGKRVLFRKEIVAQTEVVE